MASNTNNIIIKQGETIIRNSRLSGIDANICSGRHSLSYEDSYIFQNIDLTEIAADSNNINWLRFYLTPQQTKNLVPGQYLWSVRVTDYTATPNISKESSYDLIIKEGSVSI